MLEPRKYAFLELQCSGIVVTVFQHYDNAKIHYNVTLFDPFKADKHFNGFIFQTGHDFVTWLKRISKDELPDFEARYAEWWFNNEFMRSGKTGIPVAHSK